MFQKGVPPCFVGKTYGHAARDLKTPRQQKPVDSLREYAENEKYGVELHRHRWKKVNYTII